MSNDDITRLREFRQQLAVPGATRLAAGRQRLLERTEGLDDPTTARLRRSRWLPAAAVAAVVLVVSLGGVALFSGQGGSGDGEPFGSPPSAEQPTDGKTDSVPDRPDPAEHSTAVDLFEQLAATAADRNGPLVVPAGKLLYVRESNLADGQTSTEPHAYTHEMWMQVDGCIPLMIRRMDGVSGFTLPDPADPKDNHAAQVAEQLARLAAEGPSLRQPTAAYLASLPTDPDALLSLMSDQVLDSRGAWSIEYALFDQVRELFHLADPLIPPAQRAAIFLALSRLGSIASTGTPVTLAGRTVVGIAQLERGQRQQLLFDAATGDLVGYGGESPTSWFAIWRHGVVDRVGDHPA